MKGNQFILWYRNGSGWSLDCCSNEAHMPLPFISPFDCVGQCANHYSQQFVNWRASQCVILHSECNFGVLPQPTTSKLKATGWRESFVSSTCWLHWLTVICGWLLIDTDMRCSIRNFCSNYDLGASIMGLSLLLKYVLYLGLHIQAHDAGNAQCRKWVRAW